MINPNNEPIIQSTCFSSIQFFLTHSLFLIHHRRSASAVLSICTYRTPYNWYPDKLYVVTQICGFHCRQEFFLLMPLLPSYCINYNQGLSCFMIESYLYPSNFNTPPIQVIPPVEPALYLVRHQITLQADPARRTHKHSSRESFQIRGSSLTVKAPFGFDRLRTRTGPRPSHVRSTRTCYIILRFAASDDFPTCKLQTIPAMIANSTCPRDHDPASQIIRVPSAVQLSKVI